VNEPPCLARVNLTRAGENSERVSRSQAGSDRERSRHREIGELMQDLVGAERPPEFGLREYPMPALDDLLFRPVDVIMGDEFAHDDGGTERERGPDHEKGEHAGRGMQACVDKAAGMAIDPLVEKLVGRLQDEIAEEMLDLQDHKHRKDQLNLMGHSRPPE